ncbi:MAG: ABC transporter substrate-binding protein [Lachnospiraceae bacterium]|nr:ABC transporter substrate-binding protein [Lachnospiraceae bacterium]
MKKKILSAVLCAALAAATLMGCAEANNGGNDTNNCGNTTTNTTVSEDTTFNIGICQLIEHPALDAATQGFQDALKEKLGDKVTFDVQDAQGEQTTAATIVNGFVSSGYDLILANATTPLQCAAAATTKIPVLGTSVTDYATALEISDWTGATGRNISGTSDLAPIDEQENMLVDLFPSAKKVGLLFCTAEANSVYQIKLFEKALEADGIAYQEYGIADSNEVQAVVSTAASECDVLYIPTDNTLANCTETVYNIVVPAGVPVIAGEEGICAGCGVATLSISYYDLGYQTGLMAYDILVNGADITTMSVQYAKAVTMKYNAEICDKLGVTVPETYEAIQ